MPNQKKSKKENKKSPKREPSLRAKAVLKDIVASRGKKPLGKIMQDNGYSESYSTNPKQFLETVGVKSEFNDFFPREYIFKQLRKLHNAHSLRDMVFPIGVPDEVILELLHSVNCEVKKIAEVKGLKYAWYWSPDNRALKDALDMSFKIMGEYTTDKNNPANPLRELSDEELMAEIQSAVKTFKKK